MFRRRLLFILSLPAWRLLGQAKEKPASKPKSGQPADAQQKDSPPNQKQQDSKRQDPNRSGEKTLPYVIAEPCIGKRDTACVDACPVDCIHPKKDERNFKNTRMLYIDPVECIACGACVPVCPANAIYAVNELPTKWAQYAQINANYFKR